MLKLEGEKGKMGGGDGRHNFVEKKKKKKQPRQFFKGEKEGKRWGSEKPQWLIVLKLVAPPFPKREKEDPTPPRPPTRRLPPPVWRSAT